VQCGSGSRIRPNVHHYLARNGGGVQRQGRGALHGAGDHGGAGGRGGGHRLPVAVPRRAGVPHAALVLLGGTCSFTCAASLHTALGLKNGKITLFCKCSRIAWKAPAFAAQVTYFHASGYLHQFRCNSPVTFKKNNNVLKFIINEIARFHNFYFRYRVLIYSYACFLVGFSQR
jgi:hypothetical protein